MLFLWNPTRQKPPSAETSYTSSLARSIYFVVRVSASCVLGLVCGSQPRDAFRKQTTQSPSFAHPKKRDWGRRIKLQSKSRLLCLTDRRTFAFCGPCLAISAPTCIYLCICVSSSILVSMSSVYLVRSSYVYVYLSLALPLSVCPSVPLCIYMSLPLPLCLLSLQVTIKTNVLAELKHQAPN